MNKAFLDYYRCPNSFVDFQLEDGQVSENAPGYFQFGPDVICYGSSALAASDRVHDRLPDALFKVRIEGSSCILPFNPTDIADNLRGERYVESEERSDSWVQARRAYYAIRPALPVSVRKHLQRIWLGRSSRPSFPSWPVDRSVDQMFERLMRLMLQASPGRRIPFIWFWPGAKASCAIMTHDVETETGLHFTHQLMDINDSFGIRSSFQIIPDARYIADKNTLSAIRRRGFEINVHDLKHDGHLFDNHQKFKASALRINEFATDFGSSGFRSGVLYRKQDWYDEFRFSYDMSVPNVGHLDPQPGGCCTVMPYFIGKILEIPVTTTQDYSLFHILGTHSQDVWREQIKKIMQQSGLISFIVHPDYLSTSEARNTYTTLLTYLAELRRDAGLWTALPSEVDTWWRQRSAMRLVPDQSGWRAEGLGAERASIAYAALKDGQVFFEFQ